jgi:histidine triad (HIT) family protein
MKDCIFCKIAGKEVQSKIVFEDEHVVAFKDINPQAPVHILVIPRKHIPRISDITEDDSIILFKMLDTANKIAKEQGISERGYRLVLNCNEEAGQSVFHVHMHILGGRIMGWPPG